MIYLFSSKARYSIWKWNSRTMTSVTLDDEYVTDTMALILHLENRRSS